MGDRGMRKRTGEKGVGPAYAASYSFLSSSLGLRVSPLFLAHFPEPISAFIPHYCVFEERAGREKYKKDRGFSLVFIVIGASKSIRKQKNMFCSFHGGLPHA